MLSETVSRGPRSDTPGNRPLATIAICMIPVPSLLTSAIAFAKRLQQRGHEVWIISTPEVEESARLENIKFMPVLAGLFPTGSATTELERVASLSWSAKLRELRRITRIYRSILDGIVASRDNEIDHAFDRIAPDLVLIYSDIPTLVVAPLVAMRRGLRCAYLTPLFYSYRGPGSPPLRFGLVPRPGFWGEWSVRFAWTRFLTIRNAFRRLDIALGLDVNLPAYVRKLSSKQGGAAPVNWDCFLAPKLSLPEFFLAPRELEFDFEPPARCHWLGWSLDEGRADEPFPTERLDPSRPLVYCALGSLSLVYVSGRRLRVFLQAVIDALAARPHLQLALATGGALGRDDLDVSAPGAIVLDRMPQLQMLSHARMMITHCGLHSLMECASRGVPMIAFPLAFDQFGNAARVVYHGLGVRGDIRTATAESIGRLIDRVLGDGAMTQRCAAMAARARNHVPYESAMAALEALAEPS
jgi:zeaxanthin glucosyltransferase